MLLPQAITQEESKEITNGEDITFRVAFKPTATISTSQRTVNTSGEEIELKAKDAMILACFLVRYPWLKQWVVLADALLRQSTVDYSIFL